MAGDENTWCNHTGSQCCHPSAIREPSADELGTLVVDTAQSGGTLRAVGAGHAWSDVALTDGVLIEPTHLGGPLLTLDDGCLGPHEETLVRVLAGTHLHELNEALRDQGLALTNMGGYDAQTVAGVVSTSTHGSGIKFGPFPDMVRSLDIFNSVGEAVRVEPTVGLTDAAAFERTHVGRARLIQDDDVFYAVVCGMGCMGVLHSLVLAVGPKFWLNEVREPSTWEAVRGTLTETGVLGKYEHYELFVNPYPKDNEHSLVVTTRAPCPEPVDVPPAGRERHPFIEFESGLPLTWLFVRLGARYFPRYVASRFEWLLRKMCDQGYADISYKVFNIGQANKLPAYSSELGFSMLDGDHVKAVDRILELAVELRHRRRPLIHTSPIALRFVAASNACASMMYGRPTMMVELILAQDTKRGFELLAAYETDPVLRRLLVRPHWGQYNVLDGTTDFPGMYPKWREWLAAYEDFNHAGTFNSPFTDRIGISRLGT